jgi:phage tail-like protein
MTGIEPSRAQEPGPPPAPLAVSHVADTYRRYPGETVTFFTRVDVEPGVPGFTLLVALPAGVTLQDYQGPDARALPRITLHEGANNLIWRVDRGRPRRSREEEPTSYEYRVVVTVAPVTEETVLESRAVVTAEGEGALRATETVAVVVSPQGRYLDYLPAIYRDDDLMARFLMLFESFWAPVSRQIDTVPYYFDPLMTPAEFLPWLASWIDLVLDERWPVEKRRRLLAAAVALYRKRGTRQGLEEYLEIYTGYRPRIIEHRAHNFRLGQGARLGPGIALGRGNEPHTFTVVICLPAVSTVEGADGSPCEDQVRRRRIEAIIEAEKPAHAGYQLRIDTEAERELGE